MSTHSTLHLQFEPTIEARTMMIRPLVISGRARGASGRLALGATAFLATIAAAVLAIAPATTRAQQSAAPPSSRASAEDANGRALAAVGTPSPVIAIIADPAGTELTDFMIPHALLSESGVAQVLTVAVRRSRIRLWPGTLFVEPDLTTAAFDAAHPQGADYVIVPAVVDHESAAIAAWLRAQAAHGATIVSICEGARVLAHAGLLEGRNATTHWSALGELSRKYPGTTWIRDRRYVVDDHLITTTGVSASLPASIALIDRIAGRAVADSIARRIGLASWEPTHDTDAFHVTRWLYARGTWNTVAWWRHDQIGVPVADGVDEIALALTVDAAARSIRGKPFTWSEDGSPVTGRQGLRMSVDRARSAVGTGTRRLELPPPSMPSAAALDSAIARLTAWYGGGAGTLIAMGMEYPRPAAR